MNNRAATILAGAIALLAVAYFLTNLHRVDKPFIYNTVTGEAHRINPTNVE
jgi:hypothetical protein